MLSIFVEASCNRYNRDECIDCHVYEPLADIPKSAWHMTPSQAQLMATKIQQIDTLNALAKQEINLTGGEATQNPHIVEIVKIFQSVSPSVCVHTNLEINSKSSMRWLRLVDIVKGGGRADITLYPTAWEKFQKSLLKELISLQNKMIVNIIFENLIQLQEQIQLLNTFFNEAGHNFEHVVKLLQEYNEKICWLLKNQTECDETIYETHMGGTEAFAHGKDFTLGLSLLPAFKVNTEGKRSMTSIPFPQNPYIIHCPAARGSIDIMTVLQTGEMTPCCDVGNLKCQPKFGNLLTDSPAEIMAKFQRSSKVMMTGISKNLANIKNGKPGEWVEEGIPPYCG
jgi:organic radical activating enzyme